MKPIQRLLLEKRKTQTLEEISDKTQVSVETLDEIIQGRSNPGLGTTARIASAYDFDHREFAAPLKIYLAATPDVNEELTEVDKLLREVGPEGGLELLTADDDSRPADCDISIFILWSMLDDAPTAPVNPDAHHEGSSLVRAYEHAASNAGKSAWPDLWVYRRTRAPTVSLDAPDIEHRVAQWREVESFAGRLRKDPRLAVWNLFNYDSPDEFRSSLTQRLQHWVGCWFKRRDSTEMTKWGRVHPIPPESPAQFTAYYPKEVVPRETYDLLVYTYVPWLRKKVIQDSQARLPRGVHRPAEGEAQHPIRHGTEIQVEPRMEGFGCNTPQQRLVWSGDWQCIDFKLWAMPNHPAIKADTAINGSLCFYIETVLIASLPLSIFIGEKHASTTDAPTDGSAWVTDTALRVLRGGSWFNVPRYLRSAFRYGYAPVYRYSGVGFRLARTL
jgi:transcriptional regulator with XRE-family HTH domain